MNTKRNITMKADVKPSQAELVRLYDSVGWSAYTNNPTLLKQAIDQSLWVCTLFDQDLLIGLIRVVGDGLIIVYVQDILINPDYQHQGLGSQLLQQALNEFKSVRQFLLMTDDEEVNHTFYQKHGLIKTSEASLVNFFRK